MPAPTLLYQDLPISAQTNFAELVEQAQARMLQRSVQDLPGSFNRKQVKGITYWYWQFRDLRGANKQVYLGPDEPRLRELIRQHGEGKDMAASGLPELARACSALGCMTALAQHFTVINRLAEHGFFRAGGVLIGTHAFVAMSNMLGVKWIGGWETKNVSLALAPNAEANVHDAIESLEMGLLPAMSLTSGPSATYINARNDIRIDLLTAQGRSGATYRHEPLKVNLQPLRFMEYSLERTTQTALLSGEQAVLVNIPSPMRYALHKLLVMAEREEAFRVKIQKDAGQVAALVSYGMERSPGALREAAADILSRGPGWRKRLAEGMANLAGFHPDVAEALKTAMKD